MNKPTIIADKCGYILFYKDTDSLQSLFKEILKIIDKFQEENGYSLDGKEFAQFHTDLKFDNKDIPKCDIIFGIAGIWLNKKCYCIVLEGLNIETGETYYEEMFRYKGVTQESIKYYAKEWCKNNNIDTEFPVFSLYNSDKIHEIDQLVNDSIKFVYKNCSTESYSLEKYIKKTDFKFYENTYDFL